MQAGAPYMPPDCQTYSGVQKRVLIKKNRLKKASSPHIFLNKYRSLPLYQS
mgnify:CR=1 FL=1